MSKYGITASALKGSYDNNLLDPGVYYMRLTKVESREFPNNKKKKASDPDTYTSLVFTFVEEGADVTVLYFATPNSNEETKFGKLVKSLNGGVSPNPEFFLGELDFDDLIDSFVGKEYEVLLSQTEKEKGTFNSIDAILPPKKDKVKTKGLSTGAVDVAKLDDDDIPF